MPWTPQQQSAIDHEGGDVLVAAGAGAGKTGVLTERVVRKVLTGWSVTDMLVLTFTDAAAAEMRRRIGQKLAAALVAAPSQGSGVGGQGSGVGGRGSDFGGQGSHKAGSPNTDHSSLSRRLTNQVALLDAGQICTLHSFASQLIREHFHHLGLDPAFEILDSDQAALVQQEVLDGLLEECYNGLGSGVGDQGSGGRRSGVGGRGSGVGGRGSGIRDQGSATRASSRD